MDKILAAHPPWRRLLILCVAVPAVLTLAVLAFAWPAARIAPRELPVGVVGATPASEQVAHQLGGGGFDLRLYADDDAARTAIEHRDVYGAFVVTGDQVTVLQASAAGPTVARILDAAGGRIAAGARLPLRTDDVVPLSADDPNGVVFSSALLPLTIGGVLVAVAVGLVLGVRPVWRQLTSLVVVAAVAGAAAYLVAQTFLGALPHHGVAVWASLALLLLAVSSLGTAAVERLGTGGIGVIAALMVLVGNPFSGATSAPELLPGPVHRIGQLLPPGAGATLLRDIAYFDGHGVAGPITVLVAWVVIGAAGILAAHRRRARVPAEHRPGHAAVARLVRAG